MCIQGYLAALKQQKVCLAHCFCCCLYCQGPAASQAADVMQNLQVPLYVDDAPSTSGRKNAAQLAAEHEDEMAIMRDLLKQKGLNNLPGRLHDSDAELLRCCWLTSLVSLLYAVSMMPVLYTVLACRYAIACGLFRADTQSERYVHATDCCVFELHAK